MRGRRSSEEAEILQDVPRLRRNLGVVRLGWHFVDTEPLVELREQLRPLFRPAYLGAANAHRAVPVIAVVAGSRAPDRELRPLRCSGRCALAMVSAPQGSPSVGRFVEKDCALGALARSRTSTGPMARGLAADARLRRLQGADDDVVIPTRHIGHGNAMRASSAYSATVRMSGERQQGCPVGACLEDGVTGASRQGSRWEMETSRDQRSPAYATRHCKRSALQGADAFEPRPLQRRTGSQIGWPLACEELIVKIDPSGPMTSNKS